MLVLLPPSERKAAPTAGAPVDLAALRHPTLTDQRATVLEALAKVSLHPDAARVLGTSAGVAAEVDRNTRLDTAPAGPAASVYAGVLYAAAGLDTLPDDDARARALRCVRVVSALWGLVAPDDRIPAYRLAMGVDLPGVGPLARAWRPHLAAELDDVVGGQVVVDCRSAAYAAAWRPPAAAAWVTVRVLREARGTRRAVSHDAKHTRGLLTRHLLVRPGGEPTTPDELLTAARELVSRPLLDAELDRSGRSQVLTLTAR